MPSETLVWRKQEMPGMQIFSCVTAALPRGVRTGLIPGEPVADPHLESCLSPLRDTRHEAVLIAPEIILRPACGTVVPALAERDYGRWRGQSLRALAADGLSALVTDIHFAPPGGESLHDVSTRVMTWMQNFDDEGHFLIVASPAIVRILVVGAIGGDVNMNNRIDVAPLSVTRLIRRDNGNWRLQSLALPLP